jgi:hypothetical protein
VPECQRPICQRGKNDLVGARRKPLQGLEVGYQQIFFSERRQKYGILYLNSGQLQGMFGGITNFER